MIQTIGSILVLYSWIVAAILLLFLFLIGRFYEMQFRQRSYYQLFPVAAAVVPGRSDLVCVQYAGFCRSCRSRSVVPGWRPGANRPWLCPASDHAGEEVMEVVTAILGSIGLASVVFIL